MGLPGPPSRIEKGEGLRDVAFIRRNGRSLHTPFSTPRVEKGGGLGLGDLVLFQQHPSKVNPGCIGVETSMISFLPVQVVPVPA